MQPIDAGELSSAWPLAGFPALAPYADRFVPLIACPADARLAALNRLAEEQDLRNASGQALRFEAARMPLSGAAYERVIACASPGAEAAAVPTRLYGDEGVHDLLNALVWLRFPRTKATLNRLHLEDLELQAAASLAQGQPAARRSRARDLFSLLDESGAVWIGDDPLLFEQCLQRDWTGLFFSRRAQLLARSSLTVVGHGLLQQCLSPYPGMVARVVTIEGPPGADPQTLDEALARQLSAQGAALPTLVMPICGWPGWQAQGPAQAYQGEEHYRNVQVYRPAATRAP